jgi:hypothetical protein
MCAMQRHLQLRFADEAAYKQIGEGSQGTPKGARMIMLACTRDTSAENRYMVYQMYVDQMLNATIVSSWTTEGCCSAVGLPVSWICSQ